METKAKEDGGSSNAHRSGASSSGTTFTNRRQKNLQKFRKHIASQRQTSNDGPLETKPSKEATPVEYAPTTKAVTRVNFGQQGQVANTTEKPRTPPSASKKEGTHKHEEAQSATMSPHTSAAKRRADIIKKNRMLSLRAKRAAEAPKSPNSPKTPETQNEDQGSRCSAGTRSTQQEEVAPATAIMRSAPDAVDDKQTGNCASQKCVKEEHNRCEIEEDDQANENAQSKVQEKLVSSKSSEEALKPKTNNRLKARRTLHHKKFGKDSGKNKEDKATVKYPMPRSTENTSGLEKAQSKDVVMSKKETKELPEQHGLEKAQSKDVVTSQEETKDLPEQHEVPIVRKQGQAGRPFEEEATTNHQKETPIARAQPENESGVLSTETDEQPVESQSQSSLSNAPYTNCSTDTEKTIAGDDQDTSVIKTASMPATTHADLRKDAQPREVAAEEETQQLSGQATTGDCIDAEVSVLEGLLQEEPTYSVSSSQDHDATHQDSNATAVNLEEAAHMGEQESVPAIAGHCHNAELVVTAAPEPPEEPAQDQATANQTSNAITVGLDKEHEPVEVPFAERDGGLDESLLTEDKQATFAEGDGGLDESLLNEDKEAIDQGKDCHLDGKDLKVDVSSGDQDQITKKGKDTPQSDTGETSSSFDLRSIHEFPPAHIRNADASLPSQDPSWDTAKVYFTEFKQPGSSQSKEETMDLFDTTDPTPWANSTITFAGAFETSNDFFVDSDYAEVFEEKKELDHPSLHLSLETTTQPAPIEPMDSPASLVSPRRRMSRAQVNSPAKSFEFDVSNLAMDSTDELDHQCDDWKGGKDAFFAEDAFFADDKDEENLLGETDRIDDCNDNAAWENNAIISKEERLQTYTANSQDGDNSSVSSAKADEGAGDDSSHASAEPPTVEYMLQPEGENEDEADLPLQQQEPPIQIVEDAPQLTLSAEAALSADVAQDYFEMSEGSNALGDFSPPVLNGVDPMQSVSASNSDDIPAKSALNGVDPMQSVSASNSDDIPVKPVSAPSGENGQMTDNAVGGYISNSSSSCSASSSSNEKTIRNEGKEITNESKASEGDSTESNAFDDGNKFDDEEKGDSTLEPLDLEESASLVGVSLVPSFGANSGRTGSSPSPSQVKMREGIPPRGSLSPSALPPPPPPPLSKKKRRKKKNKSSSKSRKPVPLISPPPMEKLKKWQQSKNRAFMHLGVVQESHLEGLGSKSGEDAPNTSSKQVEDIVCGAFPDSEIWDVPAESPRRIKLACGTFSEDGPCTSTVIMGANAGQDDMKCGGFAAQTDETPRLIEGADQNVCGISDALKMAGLKVSPPNAPQGAQAPSPVDAARSIALENAMKRANKGLAARFDFPSPSARSQMESRSLFENEIVASTSMSSSTSMGKDESNSSPSEKAESNHDNVKVEEPPELTRQEMPPLEIKRSADKAIVFLHELTSPSLSMSPSNDGDRNVATSQQAAAISPLIQDAKMAEKAALASYAAAVTFEEQYSSRLEDACAESVEGVGSIDPGPGPDLESGMPSLFCAPELGENIQHMAAGAGDDVSKNLPSLFFASDASSTREKGFDEVMASQSGVLNGIVTGSPPRESRDGHHELQDLRGGAFSPWRNALCAKGAFSGPTDDGSVSNTLSAPTGSSKDTSEELISRTPSNRELLIIHEWLARRLLELATQSSSSSEDASDDVVRDKITRLLEDDENLNRLCAYVAEKVNVKIELENEERAKRNVQLSPRKAMKPFQLSMRLSGQKSSSVVAANFVSFIHRISKASGIPSPFGEDNPFLLDLVGTSLSGVSTPTSTPTIEISDGTTMQGIVFSRCTADNIVRFCMQVCGGLGVDSEEWVSMTEVEIKTSGDSSFDLIEATRAANPSPTKKSKTPFFGGSADETETESEMIVPDEYPSPFEAAVNESPKFLTTVLSFLGDPVAVCRLKMTNRGCSDFVTKNEQLLMRDAVRLGGLSMNLRPSFWLWVTLEKCGKVPTPGDKLAPSDKRQHLAGLEERGRTGKWHSVIARDVARSFGNMPPHKTGARLRTDSIVRALVTWGRNRIMKRGVKGDGNPPPYGSLASFGDSSGSDASQTPTDTVSDWGGVSPVASFTGSCNGVGEGEEGRSGSSRRSRDSQSVAAELLVLSGNALSEEMKADLQSKLAFILHALAAEHEEVGYCQGMDYVVAHLLRILQDTVCWRAAKGTLPASIQSAAATTTATHQSQVSLLKDSSDDGDSLSRGRDELDSTFVVEDAVFQVMDCLFTTYNLQHMYWPELRCLKTCCKVFERLIQLKLPVLADHFEHHDLNVGIFALGWFQTLFLYLPSMPSATVCHMWDIWLVERSFKIFFRVGTAILFLSQPTLLNHELEGMQIYLNTFPDATLLNPDILIACALQIKVTNKMLMDIEEEVCSTVD